MKERSAMPSAKRMMVRLLLVAVVSLWVTLWPHNYGLDADNVWLRVGAVVLLTFRAAFIGYCACFLIIRPLLTLRAGSYADDPPIPSLPDAFRLFRRMQKGPTT